MTRLAGKAGAVTRQGRGNGSAGGPVFNQAGQCVGIAFQSLSGGDAENIGYVIPTPVVDHFLSDYQRNGRFTGFPALGIRWQRMESDPLRHAYPPFSPPPLPLGATCRNDQYPSEADKLESCDWTHAISAMDT